MMQNLDKSVPKSKEKVANIANYITYNYEASLKRQCIKVGVGPPCAKIYSSFPTLRNFQFPVMFIAMQSKH